MKRIAALAAVALTIVGAAAAARLAPTAAHGSHLARSSGTSSLDK